MSLLRILRNMAVLVILALAVLGSPRSAAAKKTKCKPVVGCRIQGEPCGGRFVCCCGLVCVGGSGNSAYCKPL